MTRTLGFLFVLYYISLVYCLVDPCYKPALENCKGKERASLIVDYGQWEKWGAMDGNDYVAFIKSDTQCVFILHVRPSFFVTIHPSAWSKEFIIDTAKDVLCNKEDVEEFNKYIMECDRYTGECKPLLTL